MKYSIIGLLLIAVFMVMMQSCDMVSNDLLQDPNQASLDNANPDYLLNNIELSVASFYNDIEDEASEMTRMTYMSASTYPSAYQPQVFNSEWTEGYSSILVNIQELIPIAQEHELYIHEGIARVLKAYTLFNLVDRFGEVPLMEALNPDNFNPKTDKGRAVYQTAFAELDTARTVLIRDAQKPTNDLYYDGNSTKWYTLANTLELKALLQQINISSRVLPKDVSNYKDRINVLLNGDIIDQPTESFIFQYGSNIFNPDTRHPAYLSSYQFSTPVYLANYYLNELWQDKIVPDPRIRYYIYRQANGPPTEPSAMRCIENDSPIHFQGNGNGEDLNDPFCDDWNDVGYLGRDHGVSLSDPGDFGFRSAYGVYPAGGRFDANQFEKTEVGQGLQGAGIQPMWMSFFTDFVRAEAELSMNNNPTTALSLLKTGIQNSFDYVREFGSEAVTLAGDNGDSFANEAQSNEINYINQVTDRWNNASNAQKRLSIILKEYYLALFGNGVEAYNAYRRITPDKENLFFNLQPNVNPNPGQFYNTLKYPSAFVGRNSNVDQRDPAKGPFWFTANPEFANF